MEQRTRVAGAVALTVALFLAVQLGALALAEPFEAAGFQTVEDPQDPTNSLFYVVVLLAATGAMLLAFKYGKQGVVRGFIVVTSGLVSSYVFTVALPKLVLDGVNVTPYLGGLAVITALLVYPEWWVIDAVGVVMGMGAAALFGISFGVLPAILLLTVLAVYDAISVYGTEHMLTLASGVMDMNVPVLFVVPTRLDYSFRRSEEEMTAGGAESAADGESRAETEAAESGESADGETAAGDAGLERDALFIGLGDAVMPSILVASAAFFLETPVVAGVELAALGAVVGTTVGLLGLLRMVLAGRAHAGLPMLNGGAILGYLAGALAGGIPLVEALGLAPYV